MSSESGSTDVAVAVRDLGKSYRIYAKPQDRLRQAFWRHRRRFYEEFWALSDVSFEVRRGEALGVIGRNGSGKSTLLQILAGTLTPTAGEAQVQGRVAALLELGSGFNPDFTGRENVFMSGAILGMPRRALEERFDAVAAFADIGDFIEQPVKTYSSGMYLRLAFAVNAHVDADLLLIDEALAVGDAAFQVKCMTHMKRLLKRGVAIVLVTHDVQTVRSFCEQVVWLEQGSVHGAGAPLEVTSRYMQFLFGDQAPAASSEAGASGTVARSSGSGAVESAGWSERPASHPHRVLSELDGRRELSRWGSGELRVDGVAFDNGDPECTSVFQHGDRLHLELRVRAMRDVQSEDVGFGFSLRNTKGLDIITYTTYDAGLRFPPLRAGETIRLAFEIDNSLAPGDYVLILSAEEVVQTERRYFDFVENAAVFAVVASFPIFSVVRPPIEPLWVECPSGAERRTHVRPGF